LSSKVTISRLIAFDSFVEVIENHRKPEEILEDLYLKNSKDLKRIDRNLTKEILYGGLRWYKKIYWILQHTAKKRDLKTVSPQVRAALILGTYQIFYMDRIPDRAAVNESVEYVRAKGEASAVPFVNGILRQIARRAEYFTKPDKKTKPVEYLSLQFSHPEWLVRRWFARFSFERMETMLAANNQPPLIYIRTNSQKISPQDLQDSLLREEQTQSEKGSLKGCIHLKKHPDMTSESLFSRGFYTIQDQASQLIAHLLKVESGQVIVDAAAGPGGKLTHVAELGGDNIKLIAVEKNPRQMERAQETAQRLGSGDRIEWILDDFANFQPPTLVDRVLLDAPCTGLGVLRRHPEAKWQKNEGGISEMSKKQRSLILHALDILKVGGELIYSVCSFEPEETEEHLKWLEREMANKIEVITPVSRLPDYFKKYVTRQNLLLIFAGNQDDMDGFGAFIVRRKA
jgi:16S rRNA (cytosine967-C5)-methyltransferase